MSNVIDFDNPKNKNADDDGVENLVLSFKDFDSENDHRLAMAKITLIAKQLINQGIDIDTINYALYRSGAWLSSLYSENHADFLAKVHSDVAEHSSDFCYVELGIDDIV